MATETEKKYLIDKKKFNFSLECGFPDGEKLISSKHIRQAYLGDSGIWSVLVKIAEDKHMIELSTSVNHLSFAFEISKKDAEQLLAHETTTLIEDGMGMVCLKHWALRIRVFESGEGEICLKERIEGDSRGEIEALVDAQSAAKLFASTAVRIEKIRYFVMKDNYQWEVDQFLGLNAGLITAELETEDKDYPLLECVDRLITERKYFNEELAQKPYLRW